MSIKKNLAYNVALNVLNVLFPVVTVPYVSHVLGVEHVGLVNFATNYVNYFVIVASLGIGTYGVREIAKLKDAPAERSRLFSELFSVNLLSTLVATLLYIASVYAIPLLAKDKVLFFIAGLSLYLTPLSIDWYFQGLEQFKLITLRSVAVKLACMAGLFIFVKERGDVIAYVLLNVLAISVANLWNILYAVGKGLRIRTAGIDVIRHLKPLLVFFVSVLTVNIYMMLDTIMLGLMSNYTEVGYYTSASKIVKIIVPVFLAVSVVVFPRVSFNNGQGDTEGNIRLLQRLLDALILFSVPVTLGLALVSSRFVPLFFGPEFLGAIVPMQLLSLQVLFIGLNTFFGVQILDGFGREATYMRALLCAAGTCLLLNFAFIPLWGALGAAVSTIAAEIVECALAVRYVRKYVRLSFRLTALAHACVSCVPAIGLYLVLSCCRLDDVVFLTVLVVGAAVMYVCMQCFVFKNSLLREGFSQLKKKF